MYQPKLFITLTSSLILIALIIISINLDQGKVQGKSQTRFKEFKPGLAYLHTPLITQIENQHNRGCSCPNCLSFQLINQQQQGVIINES